MNKNVKTSILGTALSNLIIGTGLNFDTDDFEQKRFIQCAYVNKMIHINEQRIIHCEKPVLGRYVAVYVGESQRVTLSICELEVYGTTISSEDSIQGVGWGMIQSRTQAWLYDLEPEV